MADLVTRLLALEKKIRGSESASIRARWESGRELLAARQGAKLPDGLLAEVGMVRQEANYRMRFAEAYDEKALSTTVDNGQTWSQIRGSLPKKQATPRRPPKPRVEPTKGTFQDADRVEALIAKPDVAREILARDSSRKVTRKAQQTIERREKEEAARQKQDDQITQQIGTAARLRLIQGDRDWQIIVESLETFADTMNRMLSLLDGLVIPNEVRRRTLDAQLGRAQQALMQFRGRLHPDYQRKAGDIDTTSVITID